METTNLLTPILDSQLRHFHYINGRVLTADEMSVEQATNTKEHRLLGQTIGSGVAAGLDVTQDDDQTVAVSAGLALAPDGRLLRLEQGRSVSLVTVNPAADEGAVVGTDSFRDCATVDTTTPINVGNGAYILVLSPIYGTEGSAVTHRLNGNGIANYCEYAFDVAGVQFRLVRIQRNLLPLSLRALHDAFNPTDPGTFQNVLAHFCFGTQTLFRTAGDPFALEGQQSAYLEYGIIDTLRSQDVIKSCEVPLAVIGWSQGAIAFVDRWAVCRPVTAEGLDEEWPFHTWSRRQVEGQAAFLQFMDQLDAILVASDDPTTIQAGKHFRFLPAAGYLRIGSGNININTFFDRQMPVIDIDPAFINFYLNDSWYIPPVDLNAANAYQRIQVFSHPNNVEVAFFMRRERDFEPAIVDVVDDTEDVEVVDVVDGSEVHEPTERTGDFLVRVTIGESLMKKLERDPAIIRAMIEQAIDTLEVVATAGAKDIPGKLVEGPGANKRLYRRLGDRKEPALYYSITVPPGTYKVQLSGQGIITRQESHTIKAGDHITINFTLEPSRKAETPNPPRHWTPLDDEKYGKMYILPWETLVKLPEEEKWDVDPLPIDPEEQDWLIRWGEEIQTEYPGLAVDPSQPRILVDPAYDPASTPVEPYAVVEYGRGGAAVPLALTGSDNTLDRPVTVLKGDLPGVDADLALRLNAAGITELDLLPAMPATYTADLLGIGVEAAVSLGDDAREKTTALKSSLRLLSGVDSQTETALEGLLDEAAGNNSMERLANSSVDTLVDGNINRNHALRLIAEARAVVPSANWSLADERLGLDAEERVLLGALGIQTKGELIASEDLRDRLEGLGTVSPKRINNLENAATIATATRNARSALDTLSVDVTDAAGAVNTAAASEVVGREFGTVEDIVTADRDTLAAAAGSDAVANDVAAAALGSVLSVDRDTASALVAAGLTNMTALAGAERAILAGIVGEEKAGAVVNTAIAFGRSGGGRRL